MDKFKKTVLFLLFSQIIVQIFLLLNYDFDSIKFVSRLTSLLFVCLVINSGVSAIVFLILRKKDIKIPLTIGMLITNISIYYSIVDRDFSTIVNQYLSEVLVNDIYNLKFLNASISDGNLTWGVALAAYMGVLLIIYGEFFIKKKDGFDNKIEKQLIFMGTGLYLVLIPFIFIFTHFSFVGSNYQFMQGMLKYTNSAVEIYDNKNQKDNFNIKELKWFKSLDSLIDYYENDSYVKRNVTAKNKKDFYESTLIKLKKLKIRDWEEKKNITYDEMKRFHDWAQISYNFNLDGVDKYKKTMWYSEISPVLISFRENDQDTLRHSVFYLKESKNGGYYILLDFNRNFKDYKLAYIYNVFFIIYHFIYIGLFVYLIFIHSKKRLEKNNV